MLLIYTLCATIIPSTILPSENTLGKFQTVLIFPLPLKSFCCFPLFSILMVANQHFALHRSQSQLKTYSFLLSDKSHLLKEEQPRPPERGKCETGPARSKNFSFP